MHEWTVYMPMLNTVFREHYHVIMSQKYPQNACIKVIQRAGKKYEIHVNDVVTDWSYALAKFLVYNCELTRTHSCN